MQSQSQSPLPSPGQGQASSSSTSTTSGGAPAQSGRGSAQEQLHRQLRVAESYDEGAALLRPRENDKYATNRNDNSTDDDAENDNSRAPSAQGQPLQAIVLPQPVPFSESELAAWAAAQGFAWDPDTLRVSIPGSVRPELAALAAEASPEQASALEETVIKLDGVSDAGARVVSTTSSHSAFKGLAQSIGEDFPQTGELFRQFAKIAEPIDAARCVGMQRADSQAERRATEVAEGGEASLQRNPMTTQPVTPAQMKGALPIPEGTYGVFHLGKEDSIDVGSYGFCTCVGVVLMAKHANGTRSLGMAHLNSEAVETQLASFQTFVNAVSNDGASPLTVWLVGGGRKQQGSLTLALSLHEFFAKIPASTVATSLFQSKRDHSYVVHDGPEGASLHETDGKEDEALAARQQELQDKDPLYQIGATLSEALGISMLELLEICGVTRDHPLAQSVSNQN